MAKLSEYFQDEQKACQALNKYHLTFKNKWPIGGNKGKLDLYAKAAHAFDPKTPREDAFDSFQYVYDTIREWQGVESEKYPLAPAKFIFNTIKRNDCRFLSGKNLNLAKLIYPSTEADKIIDFLPELRCIKLTLDYPWMPASKVLHFVNPGLFPFWDWTYVWYKVMGKHNSDNPGAFYNEYQQFCDDHGFIFREGKPIFLLYYTLWAASYIQQSHPEFMAWFMEWMIANFAQDISKYGLIEELPRYYATAFENVAIGAALLELEQKQPKQKNCGD